MLTEQEDWAAQAEENYWPFYLLMMSHSCLAVLYLYMNMSCLWTIYLGCLFCMFFRFCFVFFRWENKRANVNPHRHHAWRAPHEDGGVKSLLNATGSQQLVLFFYDYLQRRYFIVGWFCCLEGTVTGQWLCVCLYILVVLDSEPVESVSGCLFLTTNVTAKE